MKTAQIKIMSRAQRRRAVARFEKFVSWLERAAGEDLQRASVRIVAALMRGRSQPRKARLRLLYLHSAVCLWATARRYRDRGDLFNASLCEGSAEREAALAFDA